MMRAIVILTIVFGGAANAHAVSAGIISVDDPVFGVGSLTRDTQQNLDFLDASVSFGRSYLDLSSQFSVGGDFEGFRYATQEEVRQLVINWGFSPEPVLGGTVYSDSDQLSGLIDLLGYTVLTTGSRNFTGRTGTFTTVDRIRVASLDDFLLSTDRDRVRFDQSSPLADAGGNFLVREAASHVPEPATATLGVIGVAVLLLRRRRTRFVLPR